MTETLRQLCNACKSNNVIAGQVLQRVSAVSPRSSWTTTECGILQDNMPWKPPRSWRRRLAAIVDQ